MSTKGSMQAALQAVPTDLEKDGAIDSWILPENLPLDIFISPHKFKGERFWKFDEKRLKPFPVPAQLLSETIEDYREFPVLTYVHMRWMLDNQEKIPESLREFRIYFPTDSFSRVNAPCAFIYVIEFKEGEWKQFEARVDGKPGKGSRFLMAS